MIAVSRAITDLKGEFEGGISLSVDWYTKLRQGGENLLDNINPETLKRRVPIYGGITRSLNTYYCPPDVLVPSGIYGNDGVRQYKYQPPAQFYAKETANTFTIEYINGARFLMMRHSNFNDAFEINDMDEVGTITGDMDLSVNAFDYLDGQGALEGTFSHEAIEIGDSFENVLDISSYLRGVLLLPVSFQNAAEVESIEFRLETDDTNYYSVTSTQDAIGDYIVDGWNLVRFWLSQRSETGNPDPATINSWKLRITMNDGTSQTVIIDRITMQVSSQLYLEYYSNRLFVDGTSGAWKDTATAGDYINLDRDAAGVLHYETAELVDRETSFATELARKYDQYYSRHPSSELPLSYNIAPDIGYEQEEWAAAGGSELAMLPEISPTPTRPLAATPRTRRHRAQSTAQTRPLPWCMPRHRPLRFSSSLMVCS